ncbi:unnamed protein product [Ectocarpus sp. 12 AP-2014]
MPISRQGLGRPPPRSLSQLYNINMRITLIGQPYPPPPSNDAPDLLCGNEHYRTLRYSP